jgi:putative tricarboxylic transport membrane protein
MLPDIPTFKEEGYNVIFKMFRGIAAPLGIPAETAAYYETMMKKMSELPGWREKYIKNYMLTPSWMGSKEFTQFLFRSERLFKDILTDLGLII